MCRQHRNERHGPALVPPPPCGWPTRSCCASADGADCPVGEPARLRSGSPGCCDPCSLGRRAPRQGSLASSFQGRDVAIALAANGERRSPSGRWPSQAYSMVAILARLRSSLAANRERHGGRGGGRERRERVAILARRERRAPPCREPCGAADGAGVAILARRERRAPPARRAAACRPWQGCDPRSPRTASATRAPRHEAVHRPGGCDPRSPRTASATAASTESFTWASWLRSSLAANGERHRR